MNKDKIMPNPQKLYLERVMLYGPGYVVSMVGHFEGNVTHNQFLTTIQKLQKRHPLLQAKIKLDEKNDAWFVRDPSLKPLITFNKRKSKDVWKDFVLKEYLKPFDLFNGPLIRYIILTGDNKFDIIIVCHHVICDAIALSNLLKEIYLKLDQNKDENRQDNQNQNEKIGHQINDEVLLPIPLKENIPKKYHIKGIKKLFVNFINKRWRDNKKSFSYEEYKELHQKFWDKYHPYVYSRELKVEELRNLLNKCRKNNVTIHTALCTAFRLAQIEIQGDNRKYFSRVASPVNIRKKLIKNADEVFGLYATGVFNDLKNYKNHPNLSFWDIARKYHKKLKHKITSAEAFQAQIMGEFSPTLVDSLFFGQLGMYDNPTTKLLLKIIKWDGVNSGIMISNLGRFKIPPKTDSYEIISMHGPGIFDLRVQKYVGVITINNKINFSLTSAAEIMDEDLARKEMDYAMYLLKQDI